MLSAHATHTAVSDALTSTLSSRHVVRQLEKTLLRHILVLVLSPPIRKCKQACLSFPLRRGEWAFPCRLAHCSPPHLFI